MKVLSTFAAVAAIAILAVLASSAHPKPLTHVRPTDSNTGHTTDTQALSTPGFSVTTSDNQVISGRLFRGGLDILHDNVTVKDCFFVDTYLDAGKNHSGTSTPTIGLLVSGCTFESSAIIVHNGSVENCEISGTDTIAVDMKSGSTLLSCWVHDMAFSCGTGYGSSCIQVANGVTGVTIEGNLLDPGYAQEAAISLYSHNSGLGVMSVDVYHNWIDSGRYLVLANLGSGSAFITKLDLNQNLIGTDYDTGSSYIDTGVLYSQSRNTWYGTGLPYTF